MVAHPNGRGGIGIVVGKGLEAHKGKQTERPASTPFRRQDGTPFFLETCHETQLVGNVLRNECQGQGDAHAGDKTNHAGLDQGPSKG